MHERYSREELHRLWLNFRNQKEAADMLADFALCSREAAAIMIDDFRNGFINTPRDRSLQPETDPILKEVNRSGTTDTSAKSRSDSRRTRRAEECKRRSDQKRQDPRY